MTFYDCRFDYVPTLGSITSFTSVNYDSDDIATNVGDKASDGFTCPATLDAMEFSMPGSTVKFISINLGDTSSSDQGLAGYFDKFIITTEGDATVYDLEPVIRTATITSPLTDQYPGMVNFSAYLVDDDSDPILWAVRQGTCEASTSTVYGNVDGKNNIATINTDDFLNQTFSFEGDMSGMDLGMYCFVYNPTEDSGEAGIRLTQQFNLIALPEPLLPTTKDQCKKGGWTTFTSLSFKNQGSCVSYVVSNEKSGKRD